MGCLDRFSHANFIAAFLVSTAVFAANVKPGMLLLDGGLVDGAVVAVGERGTILRSIDNARTWQQSARLTRAALTAVSFAPDASSQAGWAVGHDALILATSDGGRTWTKQFQDENLQDSLLDVLPLDAMHVIAIGAFGLFLETTNGGQAWSRRKIKDDDLHFNRLTRGPTGTLYLAGERGTLLRSTDAGQKWSSIAAPYEGSFYGILPLDRLTLLAYGLQGRVFRSGDDGSSWEPVATTQPVLLAAALKLKSNYVLLAGNAGAFLVSRDYGKTFLPLAATTNAGVVKLFELPDGNLLTLGEKGAIVIPSPP